MLWSYADAVNLAIQMHGEEKYRRKDIDKLVAELWAEMLVENEAEDSVDRCRREIA